MKQRKLHKVPTNESVDSVLGIPRSWIKPDEPQEKPKEKPKEKAKDVTLEKGKTMREELNGMQAIDEEAQQVAKNVTSAVRGAQKKAVLMKRPSQGGRASPDESGRAKCPTAQTKSFGLVKMQKAQQKSYLRHWLEDEQRYTLLVEVTSSQSP